MDAVKTIVIFGTLVLFTLGMAFVYGNSQQSQWTKETDMEAKELKTRNGWITCPKDKCVELVEHHCSPPLEKCPYFGGKGKNKVYCTYEEPTEEESQ